MSASGAALHWLHLGLSSIAAWRRYRGLSQAELARRTGLSQVWLSRIENGGGTGSAATRRKLVAALDAPVWGRRRTLRSVGIIGNQGLQAARLVSLA